LLSSSATSMIRDGTAILSGDVAELLNNMSSTATLEIKFMKDVDETLVKNISGCQGVMSCENMGDHVLKLQFNGSPEDQMHLVDMAFHSDLGLLSFNEKGKGLESLYMELTKGEDVS